VSIQTPGGSSALFSGYYKFSIQVSIDTRPEVLSLFPFEVYSTCGDIITAVVKNLGVKDLRLCVEGRQSGNIGFKRTDSLLL
jgi:hypothetical protein